MAIHSKSDFSFSSIVIRFVLSLILVMATYNPSGYSVYHWVSNAFSASEFGPVHAIAILIVVIGWIILGVATWRALDLLGVILLSLLLGAFVWLFIDLGVLTADSVSGITWIVLACLAIVLAIGMSWSHLWRRLTGQLNVEDVDD